ncbi:Tim44/TimA family putative adaptor protein [Sphingomonas sp.]|uniref:Tim44/TimA family putative adaptor protein n=1 Tax=Sphingomonas sp. TaxID=28214 RepID=UPI0025E0BFE1|nr:Tim44/TimA family putative adaptor protein [Sphingomonas sp.]
MVGIILLAMVAGFLALRLYSVLGKRTGHEQTFVAPADHANSVPIVAGEEARPQVVIENSNVFEPSAAAGIRAIIAADNNFDVARFIEGSKAAYRMILEAYWRGDEAELAELTDEDVRQSFAASIAERKAAGHVLDNRLVQIEKAIISAASLDGKVAQVTVRFDADIAAVTRDADNHVVAGSLSDAVPTHDAWTFTRTVRALDPNWILTDTDESA